MEQGKLIGAISYALENLREVDRESVREFALYRQQIEELIADALKGGDNERADNLRQRFLKASDRNTENYNRRQTVILTMQDAIRAWRKVQQ